MVASGSWNPVELLNTEIRTMYTILNLLFLLHFYCAAASADPAPYYVQQSKNVMDTDQTEKSLIFLFDLGVCYLQTPKYKVRN